MRISLNVSSFSWPGGTGAIRSELATMARAADDAGLDTVWVGDHLIQAVPGTSPDEPMLEAFTTLGHLAAVTRRVRLGTMVAAATFRPPALLIKAVTTLDVLSGGRAWFGVGAGYQREEAEAMGLPLPDDTAERFDRLEETLQLARQMWAGDESPFHGTHYHLDRPLGSPGPLTRPHPPILIGGAGERRTLPLVARYADACNLFDIPDGGATLRRKLDVLARLCDEHGRPFDAIGKSVSTRLETGESAASFTDRCRRLADLGLDHAVVITPGPWTERTVAVLGETAAALADA